MNVIVTDDGFGSDGWNGAIVPLDERADEPGVDISSDAGHGVVPRLVEAAPGLIRIGFPKSADGRGFTLARMLRQAGYSGRLRAAGHVLADQYAMARRSGFDEVEIDDELARRQPEPQWLARAEWRAHDYQSRLGRRPSAAAR